MTEALSSTEWTAGRVAMTDVTELLAGWQKLADSVDGWAYSDSMEDEAFSRDARQPFARLLDAVQAVLDLHQPDEMRMRDYITATGVAQEAPCMECGDRHPCPTVRAITDALNDKRHQ